MNNKTIYGHLSDFSEEIYKAGYYIEETLKEVYGLAIQMDSFPHPSECDCRERMIKSLERLEGYIYDKTKELRSEAHWLGEMRERVIKVLEKIDEDGEDHDGRTEK